MKCANCENDDTNFLFDEGDTFYCSKCCHRTRVSDGHDDVVECPVCKHLRDRKALHCMWCGSAWRINGENFSQKEYESANEFEESVNSSNIRYYNLKSKNK